MYIVIRQISKHKWRIESAQGVIMVEDLILDNSFQAEEFVKCYASSFQGWMYEVIPLEK